MSIRTYIFCYALQQTKQTGIIERSVKETLGVSRETKVQEEQLENKTITIKQAIMSKKIKFTGGFGEYLIMSLGLMLLSIITFGLATPYWMYWSLKYFFTRLEIVE